MLNNFFRKDLNLKDKWWHRLFLVLFIIGFIYALLVTFSSSELPRYKAIDSIENRLTENPQLLTSLVNEGERIGATDYHLYNNYEDRGGWILEQPNVICSKNIDQYINGISEQTNINNYKGNGPEEFLTLEEFKEYINNEEAHCVYTTEINNTPVIGQFDQFLGDNMKFWQESTISSILFIIKKILGVSLIFVFIAIFYYKVFLYILFGSQKNKND